MLIFFIFYFRPTIDLHDETDKDEPQDGMVPPRFIEVQKGKISLAPPKQFDTLKDRVSLNFFLKKYTEKKIRFMNFKLFRLPLNVFYFDR